MRMMSLFSILGLLVAGCASLTASSVDTNLSTNDAALLATDASAQLAATLPPARTTIVLNQQTFKSKQGKEVDNQMIEKLRARGFGVAQLQQKNKELTAVPVRYNISRLETGVILQLKYNGIEAARFYRRAQNGSLVRAAPFTIRQNTH